MRARRLWTSVLLAALLWAGQSPAQSPQFHFPFLKDAWVQNRLCTTPLRQLRHAEVVRYLETLQKTAGDLLRVEEVGRSVKGRAIFLARVGRGDTKVLLWSQMHGNEPTATAALLDVLNFLVRNRDSGFVRPILENLTVLAVPMLNPDGAEVFRRRNAQGLDINRDARDLQTPEGRVLFGLKERFHPQFGFNLHDQNGRRTVGKTGKIVAIALLAPPFDWEANDNPVRIRAKKIVSVIYQALSPYIYGHIARYDAGYMPRAFGDSMQSWGVSTVLIESGGWYRNRDDFLQQLNFIALLTVFRAIATGSYTEANPGLYDAIPENDRELYDLLLPDVWVVDGLGHPAYRADVAVNFHPATPRGKEVVGKIADLGDLNIFAAKDTLPVKDLYLAPGAVAVEKDWPVNAEAWTELQKKRLGQGYTAVLFPFSAESRNLPQGAPVWMHWGTYLALRNPPASEEDSLRLLLSKNSGVCGAVWMGGEALKGVLGLRPVAKDFLPSVPDWPAPGIPDAFVRAAKVYRALGIPARGRVRIGQVADLVLLQKRPDGRFQPVMVLVKGHTVWKNGRVVEDQVWGEKLCGAR